MSLAGGGYVQGAVSIPEGGGVGIFNINVNQKYSFQRKKAHFNWVLIVTEFIVCRNQCIFITFLKGQLFFTQEFFWPFCKKNFFFLTLTGRQFTDHTRHSGGYLTRRRWRVQDSRYSAANWRRQQQRHHRWWNYWPRLTGYVRWWRDNCGGKNRVFMMYGLWNERKNFGY